jgi:hypothetical protein
VIDTLERVTTYQQLIGGEFVDAADSRTAEVINPAYDRAAERLAELFREGFEQFEDHVDPPIRAGGPSPLGDRRYRRRVGASLPCKPDRARSSHRG